MYGKKNKKKNKNYYKNNVILSLWSKSVGIYDFRVDKMLLKKVSPDRLFCHLWQNLSLPMRARYKILEKLIFFRYIYRYEIQKKI
jgi:hypothetical protein